MVETSQLPEKVRDSVLPKPKASVVSDTLTADEIEEKMADLDALFIEKSYEEIEAIMNGEEESGGSDDEDDGEDEATYDEMDLDELTELVEERGLKKPNKVTRLALIRLLNKYDEAMSEAEAAEEDEQEEAEPEEDSGEDDDDDVGDAIKAALAKRTGKKKK